MGALVIRLIGGEVVFGSREGKGAKHFHSRGVHSSVYEIAWPSTSQTDKITLLF